MIGTIESDSGDEGNDVLNRTFEMSEENTGDQTDIVKLGQQEGEPSDASNQIDFGQQEMKGEVSFSLGNLSVKEHWCHLYAYQNLLGRKIDA
jgi:hypothetical protein